MKLSTLVFGFLICSAIGGVLAIYWKATEHSRAWNRLNSFVDQDLTKLDEKSTARLEGALAKLIPGRTPSRFMDYRPRAVWIFQPEKGPVRTVLFEVNDQRAIPGSTDIRLTTFRESGRLYNTTEFDTGHRSYMTGFALKDSPVSEYPLLEVSAGAFIGPPPERQTYALIQECWLLIRLEEGGRAARPIYSIKHFRCGPEVRPSGIADVERDLNSSNVAEVLAMLTWLAAFHQAAPPQEQNPQYQEPGEVDIHSQARNHPSIIKRLEVLAKSSELWIRQAAALALRP